MNLKSEKTFFPYYFFEVTVIMLFTVEAVLLLAVMFPPSIGREIDFSAQFSPRPEWYFLFLYELTKFFPGKWTFVGAVLLPGIAFSTLLLAPFLDNSKERPIGKRPMAAVVGFGLLLSVIGLTILSLF